MKIAILFAAVTALTANALLAAEPPAKPATRPATAPATKPALKIIPGKVIVPFENMRRPWGELVSVDLATRTGTFRRDGTDEVMKFTVMPYAELLHHAASGDLQDFKVGERAIFRLHPNEAGEWVWLTYIQDEMNFMLGHKEFFHVDAIDAAAGQLTVTQANADKSYVREKDIVVETDGQTRFWKAGQPATFADIKIGDQLRTKTHGVGTGKSRVAWEVFLDEASLLKFQAEQKAVHAERMKADGAPGYIDAAAGTRVNVTVFNEGADVVAELKAGSAVTVAPAGVDRKPTAAAVSGTVVSSKKVGRQTEMFVDLSGPADGFKPTGLMRLWVK